jgi:hypothetical protein
MYNPGQKNQRIVSEFLVEEPTAQSPNPTSIKTKILNVITTLDSIPRSRKIGLGVFCFFIFLVAIRPKSVPPVSAPTYTVPVLLNLVPIQKGQLIDAQLLKQIEIYQKDLTPKQRIDRLTVEQIQKFESYRIRAKKNLPPHKIIFWTDLEFISPNKAEKLANPIQIIPAETI